MVYFRLGRRPQDGLHDLVRRHVHRPPIDPLREPHLSRSTQGATLLGLIAILFWSTSVGVTRSTIEFLGRTGAPAVMFTVSALLLLPTRTSLREQIGRA